MNKGKKKVVKKKYLVKLSKPKDNPNYYEVMLMIDEEINSNILNNNYYESEINKIEEYINYIINKNKSLEGLSNIIKNYLKDNILNVLNEIQSNNINYLQKINKFENLIEEKILKYKEKVDHNNKYNKLFGYYTLLNKNSFVIIRRESLVNFYLLPYYNEIKNKDIVNPYIKLKNKNVKALNLNLENKFRNVARNSIFNMNIDIEEFRDSIKKGDNRHRVSTFFSKDFSMFNTNKRNSNTSNSIISKDLNDNTIVFNKKKTFNNSYQSFSNMSKLNYNSNKRESNSNSNNNSILISIDENKKLKSKHSNMSRIKNNYNSNNTPSSEYRTKKPVKKTKSIAPKKILQKIESINIFQKLDYYYRNLDDNNLSLKKKNKNFNPLLYEQIPPEECGYIKVQFKYIEKEKSIVLLNEDISFKKDLNIADIYKILLGERVRVKEKLDWFCFCIIFFENKKKKVRLNFYCNLIEEFNKVIMLKELIKK